MWGQGGGGSWAAPACCCFMKDASLHTPGQPDFCAPSHCWLLRVRALWSQRPALLILAGSTEMQQLGLACLPFWGATGEPWAPGRLLSASPLTSASSLRRELNGNNITRINKNDFAGLKQLRVL